MIKPMPAHTSASTAIPAEHVRRLSPPFTEFPWKLRLTPPHNLVKRFRSRFYSRCGNFVRSRHLHPQSDLIFHPNYHPMSVSTSRPSSVFAHQHTYNVLHALRWVALHMISHSLPSPERLGSLLLRYCCALRTVPVHTHQKYSKPPSCRSQYEE